MSPMMLIVVDGQLTRSFRIQHDGTHQLGLQQALAGVVDDRLVVLVAAMREVHAHHVHTSAHQLGQTLHILGFRANRADNLRADAVLLHLEVFGAGELELQIIREGRHRSVESVSFLFLLPAVNRRCSLLWCES